MGLGLARFAIFMLAALSLSIAVGTLMQLPARLAWDQYLWVGAVTQGGFFGLSGKMGVLLQLLTLISLIGFGVYTKLHGGTGMLFFVSAVFYLLGLIAWWLMVYPANVELDGWVNGPVPSTWTETRARWEWGEALNGLLQLVGFAVLVASVTVFRSLRDKAKDLTL